MHFSKTFILSCRQALYSSNSFIPGVVDIDDKFITGFIVSSDKLLPVSLLPHRQLINAGIIVTGDKLIIRVMK
jgi:hypothetical protein